MEDLKYRFKKEYRDSQIQLAGRRGAITKDSLTNETAELLLKIDWLKHNIELIPEKEEISISLSVKELKPLIAEENDSNVLQSLIAEENEAEKPRASILKALNNRLAELSDNA
jgi:hypothetical protein